MHVSLFHRTVEASGEIEERVTMCFGKPSAAIEIARFTLTPREWSEFCDALSTGLEMTGGHITIVLLTT